MEKKQNSEFVCFAAAAVRHDWCVACVIVALLLFQMILVVQKHVHTNPARSPLTRVFEILLYEVSVPTDQTISPAPLPIPPLRHPRCFSCTWLIQAALFMSHKWCHCVTFFFFFQRLLTRSIPSGPPDAWEQVKIIRQCFHSISSENLIEHSFQLCVWLLGLAGVLSISQHAWGIQIAL